MLLSAHFQRLSGLMCAGITAQMNTTGLKLSFFQRSDLSAVSLILKVFSSFLTPEQVRTVGVMFWPKCLHWCGSNYIYHFPLQKSQFHNNWLHNYLIKVALIDWLLYVMGNRCIVQWLLDKCNQLSLKSSFNINTLQRYKYFVYLNTLWYGPLCLLTPTEGCGLLAWPVSTDSFIF